MGKKGYKGFLPGLICKGENEGVPFSKHSLQYTDLSPVGLKGSSKCLPHLSQTASNILLSWNLSLLAPGLSCPESLLKHWLQKTGLSPVGLKGSSHLFPHWLHVASYIWGLPPSLLPKSRFAGPLLLKSASLALFLFSRSKILLKFFILGSL